MSPDGRRVFAWDEHNKVLAWDLATGQPAEPGDLPPRPDRESVLTPDGRYQIAAEGSKVVIVDLRRNRWPLPDADNRVWCHDGQAADADEAGQPFAAAFHRSRAESARSELALNGGDVPAAFWHRVTAELLKPRPASLAPEAP